jgi:hypothetical protein
MSQTGQQATCIRTPWTISVYVNPEWLNQEPLVLLWLQDAIVRRKVINAFVSCRSIFDPLRTQRFRRKHRGPGSFV